MARAMDQSMTTAELRELAITQRLLLAAIVVSFVAACTSWLLFLLVLPFQLYCAWRYARVVKVSAMITAVYILLMLVPIVGVLALVILSLRARALLKAGGLKVGILGVRGADLPSV